MAYLYIVVFSYTLGKEEMSVKNKQKKQVGLWR